MAGLPPQEVHPQQWECGCLPARQCLALPLASRETPHKQDVATGAVPLTATAILAILPADSLCTAGQTLTLNQSLLQLAIQLRVLPVGGGCGPAPPLHSPSSISVRQNSQSRRRAPEALPRGGGRGWRTEGLIAAGLTKRGDCVPSTKDTVPPVFNFTDSDRQLFFNDTNSRS